MVAMQSTYYCIIFSYYIDRKLSCSAIHQPQDIYLRMMMYFSDDDA